MLQDPNLYDFKIIISLLYVTFPYIVIPHIWFETQRTKTNAQQTNKKGNKKWKKKQEKKQAKTTAKKINKNKTKQNNSARWQTRLVVFFIPPLDESRGYIGILMSVRPSHLWFPDND